MSLHFVDRLPVLDYREVTGRGLAFAWIWIWIWDQPCLRVTFTGDDPSLIGRVTHLDGLPRLVAAPDNLAWLQQDDPARTLAILDFAVDLWRRKDRIFRTCNG